MLASVSGFFWKPIDYSFAEQIFTQLPKFSEIVKALSTSDQNNQRSLIGADYFVRWIQSSSNDPNALSVTLRQTNHVNEEVEQDNTDLLAMYVPQNLFLLQKNICPCLDLHSITSVQWNLILKIFSGPKTSFGVRFSPLGGDNMKGKYSIFYMDYAKTNTDAKALSVDITKFNKKVEKLTLKLNAVLKTVGDSESRAELYASTPKFIQQKEAPPLLFNNLGILGRTINSDRINQWLDQTKKNLSSGQFATTTFMRFYQLNASNLEGNYRGTLQTVFNTEHPDKLYIFSPLSEVSVAPTLFGGTINLLIHKYPREQNELNRLISPIFQGITFSGFTAPAPSYVPSWFLGAYRPIDLSTKPNLDALLPKLFRDLSANFATFPHYTIETSQEQNKALFEYKKRMFQKFNTHLVRTLADVRKYEADVINHTRIIKLNRALEVSENWKLAAKGIIENFNSYDQDIQKNNLEQIPSGWTFVQFNCDRTVEDIHTRGVLIYYNDEGGFDLCGNWIEGTVKLTDIVDLESFTNEELEVVNNYLLKVSNDPTYQGVLIQVLNASEDIREHQLKKVVFQAYAGLLGSQVDGATDENDDEVLAESLANFHQITAKIRDELNQLLSNIGKKECVVPDPSETVTPQLPELKVAKDLKVIPYNAASTLIKLTTYFNNVFYNRNTPYSFIVTGFTEESNRGYVVSYKQKDTHYRFEYSLTNPIPFTSLTTEIEHAYRCFCNEQHPAPVTLVNNYGLPDTILAAPYLTSLIVEATPDVGASPEQLQTALLRLLKASAEIQNSFR